MTPPDKAEKAPRSAMTNEHKAALALGREQSRAVRTYLEALAANKPKRGRKRTAESIDKRLAAIDNQLKEAAALKRLHLVQERLTLAAERETVGTKVDVGAFEEAFVGAAGPYADRKGISYAAWRAAGVDATVLKRAGIRRAGGAD